MKDAWPSHESRAALARLANPNVRDAVSSSSAARRAREEQCVSHFEAALLEAALTDYGRSPVTAVPRDRKDVIPENDASKSDVFARPWRETIDAFDETTPANTVRRDELRPQQHHELNDGFRVSPSAPHAHDSLLTLLSRAAPRQPIADDAIPSPVDSIDAQTRLLITTRVPQARWRLIAVSIAAILVAGALIVLSLRADLAAYSANVSAYILKSYTGWRDDRGIDGPTAHQIGVAKAEDSRPAQAPARKSLADERPARTLSEQFVAPQYAVVTDSALSSGPAGETGKIGQETEKSAGPAPELTNNLATTHREIATEATVVPRADKIAPEDPQSANVAMAELQQALQQERDRIRTLAQDLAAARGEIAKLSSKGLEELAQVKQAAESTAAELRASLQQERQRAGLLAQDLESARRTADERIASDLAAISQVVQVQQVVKAAAEQPSAKAQDSPGVAKLLARAGVLLHEGNIGAARTVLEHAADAGSARARFALAETYDPLILARWGTYGTQGDAAKAREHYAKALAGGVAEARDRVNALQQ